MQDYITYTVVASAIIYVAIKIKMSIATKKGCDSCSLSELNNNA